MLPVDDRSLVTSLRVPSVVRAAPAAASFANVAAFHRAAAPTMCHSRGREGATCEAKRQTTAASRHGKDEALRRAQRWATKAPCHRRKARANGRFAEASAAATAAAAGGEGASEGMGLIDGFAIFFEFVTAVELGRSGRNFGWGCLGEPFQSIVDPSVAQISLGYARI